MIYLPEEVSLEKDPYKHFFSEYIVDDVLHQRMINWLRADAPWKLVEADFYTQFEFSLKHTVLPYFMNFLVKESYLNYLKKYMESMYETRLLSKFDVVGHLLTEGHIIKIHNDYIHETTSQVRESHRLLMHFNENWDVENGGLCMVFTDSDSSSISNIVIPNDKLLNGFEISQDSYHAVSQVHSGNRITLIFTFYSEDKSNV
ncbi:cyclophane-containing peptide 2OG-Fe(II) oxygenase YhhC [Psychrobacter sp. P11G5]|uniref:cyclophane-containing peptide 2OG-Fe(II) oxygenase YhhC n=1 Tax=Psychrobacter sp. P11G5 TaxID=1699624 RepID=UPI00078EBAB5|nr:cyclophane-containing peptide 2OG-Fe(II) oxygenase YhhC [Psychrobacter sp. P11G5]AMN67226.1 hypothetical protein AK825_05440 [Psychrobacter sp. P11G5]